MAGEMPCVFECAENLKRRQIYVCLLRPGTTYSVGDWITCVGGLVTIWFGFFYELGAILLLRLIGKWIETIEIIKDKVRQALFSSCIFSIVRDWINARRIISQTKLPQSHYCDHPTNVIDISRSYPPKNLKTNSN